METAGFADLLVDFFKLGAQLHLLLHEFPGPLCHKAAPFGSGLGKFMDNDLGFGFKAVGLVGS